MISVLPVKNQERLDRILGAIPQAESNAAVLELFDQGESLGWVAVDIKSSVLRMLEIELGEMQERDFFLDFLMRAAASFGANFGAYRIESQAKAFDSVLERAGFRREGEFLTTDLGNIIHVSNPGH